MFSHYLTEKKKMKKKRFARANVLIRIFNEFKYHNHLSKSNNHFSKLMNRFYNFTNNNNRRSNEHEFFLVAQHQKAICSFANENQKLKQANFEIENCKQNENFKNVEQN